jgi:hypothetical protein
MKISLLGAPSLLGDASFASEGIYPNLINISLLVIVYYLAPRNKKYTSELLPIYSQCTWTCFLIIYYLSFFLFSSEAPFQFSRNFLGLPNLLDVFPDKQVHHLFSTISNKIQGYNDTIIVI